MKGCLMAVLHEPCIEVAGYSIVGAGIGTVGGDVHLDDIVALQVVILCCGRTDGGVGRQHYDAAVVIAHANLVLGAYHAKALHAAQLATLDGETLVAIIEHSTQGSDDDLLTGSHIGRTADNL